MNNFGTFTKLSPQGLLRHLASCNDTTCLTASSNLATWSIYLEEGKITYATHSIEPFDRLECHLRRLSQEIPQITSEIRVQLRLNFETEQNQSDISNLPADYQAIYWLINQGYLDTQQAILLVQELVKEVITSFLLINTGNYQLSDSQQTLEKICRLDVEKVIEYCKIQLHNWQSLSPYISSPYQRPYLLLTSNVQSKDFPDLQPNLTHWMKGFSLRHLAVMMQQDEIELAAKLYPYIIKGGIILHEPDPPFDQLPRILGELSFFASEQPALLHNDFRDKRVDVTQDITPVYTNLVIEDLATVEQYQSISAPIKENFPELTISKKISSLPEKVKTAAIANPKKSYKIVSVDDSPTILKEISHFLEGENFNVVTINEPLKAVMSIIRHKPDLILLDLNMAGIDGYELCRIIRNNPMFQNTPVIFVTGYKGIVDKVRARIVGASGYLTKPFTRAELLKIVFRHLI